MKPMSSPKVGSALLTLALLSVTAPAHALFGDDVARKGVAEQRSRVDGLTARYDDLAARMTKFEDALKAQAAAANQPLLDLANQLQAMREEMRGMRGQMEVLTNNIESASKRQRDMYVDLDTRLRRIEQAPAAAAPGAGSTVGAPSGAAASMTSSPAGSAASPTGSVAGSTAASPQIAAAAAAAAAAPPAVDETRAYDSAQNYRRQGNFGAAVVAFQNFVTNYPRSPLAHRAQYWVGDSYYNMRDYKNAIANQQRLLSTYPESASVPDALLNMASSYLELGDSASARKTMDTLVARHPNSEAAEKARRRLTAFR